MYLGLDLGTSGVKALVIDEAQRIVASASAPLEVSRPRPGWSEQDPADWIAAAEAALDTLAAADPRAMAALRGVGLSGQMHGATLLDGDDKVLRPCILWNDSRSSAEAARLDADPRFRAISGNIVFPGFTAPKLLWTATHEPEIHARVRTVLLPKDYLRLWLTGERVAEMSDASGTSWLDTGARRWSTTLLEASGVTPEQMPRLAEGTDAVGALRPALAERWGVVGPVAVAGGAGDSAASAIGAGAVAEGSAFLSLGTSGVLVAANPRFSPAPATAVHSFCHAFPAMWHQMGVILSAASALEWFAGVADRPPSALIDELGDRLRPPGEALFLPYLSGERTPHNDAAARGSFAGLGHETDRAAMTRAVLEGVAFALRDNLEALRSAGVSIERVMALGGGSRSRYWLKAIATLLDMPVDAPVEGDVGAAFGAARLGLLAATGADPRAVCAPPEIAAAIEPEPAHRDAFEAAYGRFRALYPAYKAALSGAG